MLEGIVYRVRSNKGGDCQRFEMIISGLQPLFCKFQHLQYSMKLQKKQPSIGLLSVPIFIIKMSGAEYRIVFLLLLKNNDSEIPFFKTPKEEEKFDACSAALIFYAYTIYSSNCSKFKFSATKCPNLILTLSGARPTFYFLHFTWSCESFWLGRCAIQIMASDSPGPRTKISCVMQTFARPGNEKEYLKRTQ